MALTRWSTWKAANSGEAGQVQHHLLTVKGIGDNNLYVLEADPTTGAIPIIGGGTTLDFGPSAAGQRVAALLGNTTGQASFGAGVVGAQTLRTTPASDSPHLLAARHEAVGTPLATRKGNGASFDDYGAGATSAATPRNVPASDAPHLLNTRHEAAATPLSTRKGNGASFDDYGAGATSAATPRTVPANDAPHLLNTRHEAVGTPLSARLGNGAAFADFNAGASTANTLRMARSTDAATFSADGTILGTALTGSYQTLVTLAANCTILALRNTTDKEVVVTLDNGSTDTVYLDAGESLSVDFSAGTKYLASGSVIRVKHTGAAGTLGKVKALAIY